MKSPVNSPMKKSTPAEISFRAPVENRWNFLLGRAGAFGSSGRDSTGGGSGAHDLVLAEGAPGAERMSCV